MAKPLRLLLALFAIVSLSAAVAACGDDDDDAASDTTEATTADEGDEEGTDEGEDADAIVCADGDTEIFPASDEPADDATPVTITGTEYAFAGTEAISAIGSYAVTFENAGQEMHELIVTRINDDETRPIAELLQAASAGENPEDFSEDVASASACPGATTEVGVDIEEPGRYVLLCFFPSGALPGQPGSALEGLEGPPHAAAGMLNEVTIS